MGDTIFGKQIILQPSSEIKPGYGLQTDGSNLYFNNEQIDIGSSVPSLQQVTEVGNTTDRTVFFSNSETSIVCQGTSNLIGPVEMHSGLEVAADLKVGGGIEVDNKDVKGLKIIGNPHTVEAPQAGISFNDLTQTWDITADSQFNTLFFGHFMNGASTGSDVAGITRNATTGKFGAYFPASNEFRLLDIPTSSTGLTSGTVWSNAGVLNIIP